MTRNPWTDGFFEAQRAWSEALGLPKTGPAGPSDRDKAATAETAGKPQADPSGLPETLPEDEVEDLFNDLPI